MSAAGAPRRPRLTGGRRARSRLAQRSLGVAELADLLQVEAVLLGERLAVLLGLGGGVRGGLGLAAVGRPGVRGVLALQRLVGTLAGEGAHAREVDAELLGGA